MVILILVSLIAISISIDYVKNHRLKQNTLKSLEQSVDTRLKTA